MKHQSQITLAQWNELPEEGKEKLRKWAVHQGYELDLVPGLSGTFDPVCDYAALLTPEQMNTFLKENNQGIITENQEKLWTRIKKYVS